MSGNRPAPLLPPSLEVHSRRVEESRTIPQLRRPDESRVVSLGSPAAGGFVDLAAHVGPIRFSMTVPVENREHEMDETNIAGRRLNQKARNEMPARMSVARMSVAISWLG